MTRRGVLAIDLGSSSVRAGLVAADGAVLEAAAKRPHELETGADGRSQADPDALVALVADAVDEALAERPDDVELAGVAMSTLWHSVCGVDAQAKPTTPVLTWADRRAAQDARDLRDELDERAVHRRTGCVLHSSYVPAKLRWLARTRPEAFGRTERWLSPGEYALLRFCGEARVGLSMASGTGLLDVATRDVGPRGARRGRDRAGAAGRALRRAARRAAGGVGRALAGARAARRGSPRPATAPARTSAAARWARTGRR